MKNNVITKSMAVRNVRTPRTTLDPFRLRPAQQAKFNRHPEPMPPGSQLRYPVLFALALCMLALAVINFAMLI